MFEQRIFRYNMSKRVNVIAYSFRFHFNKHRKGSQIIKTFKANVQKRILQCLQNGLTKVNPLNSRENRENDYDDAPRRIPNGPLINAQRSPSLNFRREV